MDLGTVKGESPKKVSSTLAREAPGLSTIDRYGIEPTSNSTVEETHCYRLVPTLLDPTEIAMHDSAHYSAPKCMERESERSRTNEHKD